MTGRHRLALSLVLVASLTAGCAFAPARSLAELALPPSTTQVLLSTTADWHATAATVECFERTANGWRRVGGPIAARVGRSGLGWGLGRHRDGAGPTKREGDGRAPAGVFAIRRAFGYATEPPSGVAMPYRVATDRDYFVDAAESPDYNRWRRIPDGEPNEPRRRWRSFERMRRDDHRYEFGLIVDHNTAERIPGRGSAIFVHVWAAPDVPTSGCTAMARSDLLRVLGWLRPDSNPVLIQVPQGELASLRSKRPASANR